LGSEGEGSDEEPASVGAGARGEWHRSSGPEASKGDTAELDEVGPPEKADGPLEAAPSADDEDDIVAPGATKEVEEAGSSKEGASRAQGDEDSHGDDAADDSYGDGGFDAPAPGPADDELADETSDTPPRSSAGAEPGSGMIAALRAVTTAGSSAGDDDGSFEQSLGEYDGEGWEDEAPLGRGAAGTDPSASSAGLDVTDAPTPSALAGVDGGAPRAAPGPGSHELDLSVDSDHSPAEGSAGPGSATAGQVTPPRRAPASLAGHGGVPGGDTEDFGAGASWEGSADYSMGDGEAEGGAGSPVPAAPPRSSSHAPRPRMVHGPDDGATDSFDVVSDDEDESDVAAGHGGAQAAPAPAAADRRDAAGAATAGRRPRGRTPSRWRHPDRLMVTSGAAASTGAGTPPAHGGARGGPPSATSWRSRGGLLSPADPSLLLSESDASLSMPGDASGVKGPGFRPSVPLTESGAAGRTFDFAAAADAMRSAAGGPAPHGPVRRTSSFTGLSPSREPVHGAPGHVGGPSRDPSLRHRASANLASRESLPSEASNHSSAFSPPPPASAGVAAGHGRGPDESLVLPSSPASPYTEADERSPSGSGRAAKPDESSALSFAESGRNLPAFNGPAADGQGAVAPTAGGAVHPEPRYGVVSGGGSPRLKMSFGTDDDDDSVDF